MYMMERLCMTITSILLYEPNQTYFHGKPSNAVMCSTVSLMLIYVPLFRVGFNLLCL